MSESQDNRYGGDPLVPPPGGVARAPEGMDETGAETAPGMATAPVPGTEGAVAGTEKMPGVGSAGADGMPPAAETMHGMDDEQPPEGGSKKKWLWALIIFLIAAVVIALVLIFVLPGDEVAVPDLTNVELTRATSMLTDAGLEVGDVTYSSDVDPGILLGAVASQSPEAGAKVKKGSKVDLVIAEEAQVEVPNVVGLNVDEATSILEDAGLVAATEQVDRADASEGIVLSQSPEQGTVLAPGDTVTLSVASGRAPQVSVPSVTGRTEADAAAAIRTAGLVPGPSSAYSDTVPAGSVVSQSPAGGTTVDEGSLVAIEVSLGAQPPVTATVPDVIGKAANEANSLLTDAGYQVRQAEAYSESVATGMVGWQVPIGGSITEPGITVAIIVSAGPRPPQFIEVPDVTTMSLADATTALENAGLQAESLEFYTGLAAAGEVVAQLPVAGSAVAPGATVILLVSNGPAPASE